MASNPHTAAVADGEDEVRFRRYCFCFGPEKGAHPYSARLIHIGSAPDNDLVVDSPTVSRQHARLEFVGPGYLLRDLGSKNGTFVDGVRVMEAFVTAGARVRLGTAEMEFRLEDETVQVALSRAERYGQLIGRSSQMREIFALLAKAAPTRATVLVEGESGTGKELVADAIHQHSPRREAPFVVFDCSAVAPELIESELFGHVKGAFTGAVAARKGVFELAHGGTLFLDEVGELPVDLQPKLLRVLETGQVRPVGSGELRRTDVRVVAATNRQLEREVEAGQFREDLYYRLAVIKVKLPPLRLRPEDIPLLVKHFLDEAGSQSVHVGFETMQRLQQHPWQGNVRELKNYLERAVVLADNGRIETRFLTDRGLGQRAGADAEAAGSAQTVEADYDLPFKDAKARLLDTFERRYWLRLLEETDGNVSEAARRGGIHRKSLEYLVKKLDLRADTGEDL
ncbi:MAG: sigma 54-dependent Fis family transcriptional regulator [Deltaproteobacteria bacterium]|nr:sigma 54-dependent Fis family transcriptional regulator [Deltaproteobacteria bacterium]MCB9785421.1 sigma 54-dependent Fis family transcriptional regulator [Deltaproteobacteria bacterium]